MSNGREIGSKEVKPLVKRFVVVTRGKWNLFVLTDRRNQQHIGRSPVQFKVFGNVLFQNGRRERTEALAILNLEIQFLLHFRVPRISQNAAVAKSARAELHPALKPSDDIPFFQLSGNLGSQASVLFKMA